MTAKLTEDQPKMQTLQDSRVSRLGSLAQAGRPNPNKEVSGASCRDGHQLTSEEIQFFIQSYTQGHIPDYQAAAWCMAVLLRCMTQREATDLTLAMARSGEMLDLHPVAPFVVDKHSTGGVGDKTTLVVAPLVANWSLRLWLPTRHCLSAR
jgi:hypothetical protein